ncbi:PREDICTED: probable ATP-dependent RNA helicase DDX28 [Polistes dominula]|uniref:RNA helicase n=1 Tax=Polistes dominula TaxID=743375 RepID=A0ABM1HVX7_POLDO|nr:PREDICTED: probable ATP-dependent RNA helicase DDX28 [Polistes dominula]
MLFRYCNLCYQNITVSIINLRKYGKRVGAKRFKKREVKKQIALTPEERKLKTPIILCKRPMFNFYKGDIYSKYEPIPLNSKGWNRSDSKGDHFCIYPEKTLTSNEDIQKSTFEEFNLDPSLYKKLEELEYTTPLEIQKRAIPKILRGLNTIIAAETGCGKTMAYLVPLIDQILNWKPMLERSYNSPLGLIVTPSRELAIQIGEEARKLSNGLDISTKILTGGKTKRMILKLPMNDVDLVIASFGVISKLTTSKLYKLNCVKHIVLDEADALFHETFEEKLNVFMKRLPIAYQQTIDENGMPKNAQLTLASATMPQRISEVLGNIVNADSLVKIVTEQLHRISVPQTFVRMGPSQKPYQLLKFIKPKVKSKEPVIIFSNNTATCDFINMFLEDCGINNVCLNGNMPLELKQGKYKEFKNGKVNILSTTNMGSRGLDTIMVRHILNYEFPMDTADYIHRCGRVGRVGSHQDCKIVNFISSPLEIRMVQKIEKAIRKKKPIPIFNIMNEHVEDNLEPLSSPDDAQEDDIIEDINDEDSIPY